MTEELDPERFAKSMNPWHPMTDAVSVKVLGKLGEEVNELGSAVCRCIIQGIDEHEPVSHKPNKLWLLEEMADVQAGIDLANEKFFDSPQERAFFIERTERKKKALRAWHRMA